MSRYVPQRFPHQWLPEDLELKTWEQIEPWYQKMMAVSRSRSASELEHWLIAAGELNAAVGEEGAKRYVAMTCQTDDPEREAAYLAFVRDIEPRLKPIQNAIRNRYLDAPVPIGAAARPLFRVRSGTRKPPQPVSRGQHPARDAAGRARAAVSEDHRCDDRDLSRRGANAGADGPVSRRDRPIGPPGSVGAGRPPPACRTAKRSTTCSTR